MKLHDTKTFMSDRARLHTLLRNLIGNAVKYRKKTKDAASFVEFRVSKMNGQIIIEVEDNGEGVAEKNKDKIFDMFFRASNTSTGTGLGLYICKQIVDKLNGKLELITSEETGSLFRVTLPEYQKEA
jgi:signal transduction histidine kinase